MVWLAEWPLRPVGQRSASGNRVDRRDLQGLVFIQRWQQAGQAAGEQGLAGAGWAAQQEIVGAGRGDQQGALGGLLTLYVGEVGVGRRFP
ncbi:hypothetical protein D9M71_620240 [compost metagenome]